MTKLVKSLIVIVVISQIIVLGIASVDIHQKSSQNKNEIIAYYSKRDQLLLEQHNLESMILQLNSTLDIEKRRQDKLALELAAVTKEQQNIQAVAKTIPSPPAPKPVMVQTPTTRAS